MILRILLLAVICGAAALAAEPLAEPLRVALEAAKKARKKPAAEKQTPAKQQGDKGAELCTPGSDAAAKKDKLWTPDS